jgi:hypothetical protein
MIMRITAGYLPFAIAAFLAMAAGPAFGSEAEPTKDDCTRAVEHARLLSQSLPQGNLSRYFAERHLQQALAEAGNGEYDDCLEWARKAEQEVSDPHHVLKPGEALVIRNGGVAVSSPSPSPQVKAAD